MDKGFLPNACSSALRSKTERFHDHTQSNKECCTRNFNKATTGFFFSEVKGHCLRFLRSPGRYEGLPEYSCRDSNWRWPIHGDTEASAKSSHKAEYHFSARRLKKKRNRVKPSDSIDLSLYPEVHANVLRGKCQPKPTLCKRAKVLLLVLSAIRLHDPVTQSSRCS